jgi:hypothetical protein
MDMNFTYYKKEGLIAFVLVGFPICIYITSKLGVLLGTFIPTDLIPLSEAIKHGLDICSPSLLFGLLLKRIDKSLWKYSFMKWLIDIPDLNGRYEGKAESSWLVEGKRATMQCVYEIKQDASKIEIEAYFKTDHAGKVTSSGKMVSGELRKDPMGYFQIYFIYENEPEVFEKENGLLKHNGASVLRYNTEAKSLIGKYFTDRPTEGKIDVVFKQGKLLNRFE